MFESDDENFIATTQKIERRDKFRKPKDYMKKRGKNFWAGSRNFDSTSFVDEDEEF